MKDIANTTVGTYPNAQKAAIQNMLGITDLISTEESTTATAAHTINSTFMMGGKLYRATAAIAIGDAVEVGTNCEVVKADEVFVKNTDIATSSTCGIIKTNANFGTAMRASPYQDTLMVAPAGEQNIKEGVQNYQPIVPSRQHISVYYGLSKLAGVDLANETVTVGTYPETSKTAIRSLIGAAASDIPSVPVQDIQVNGTSVLSQGIANVPVASANDYGVVKTNANYGTQISYGNLAIVGASGSDIQEGTNGYKIIAPKTQHTSTFYGLAKAAGVDMASSSTPVGTYTDAAKVAIRNMLGATSSNVIAVQDEQPTDTDTKVWLPETEAQGIQVPTMEDMANYVQKTDYATTTSYGLLKVGTSSSGLQLDPSGYLKTYCALSADVKAGTDYYKPIVPVYQHAAAFYGLAKAAGDATQSASSNAVGTYTVEAQSAIKSMIGVGEEAYFINKKDFTNPTTVNSNASSVINAALIAAKAAGKNYCVIPEGEYWLIETIYLQDGVILKGSGMDVTTLKIADGCDIDAIRVASPINNSGVMDLSIDGNRITNYSTFSNGHHGNAINVWLHYGRIERVRTNWIYKHSLLLNYDTGNGDDGLGFDSEHQNDVGNLNKVLWCDFRDSLLQGVMWGWRTMDSWMCYTNIGSHAANLYLEGGTSRFIGNHFDGDGDNGVGPEYNVYCGDGCKAMLFDGNIFENTQKQNIFFRQPSYSNQTMTITISNNIIRTCSKSQNEQYSNIYISGYSNAVKATEITISGNQILNPDTNANHGYAGIHLAYCENCKIVGNTFFNVGNDDVIIDNTCDNVLNDSALPKDVQVNGTSVVSNGVAAIPKASGDTFGVVKVANQGVNLNSNNILQIVPASLSTVKDGTGNYNPIVPSHQHEATFYGLAKAAGDTTMASSSNAVGTYTTEAKAAIHTMLGIDPASIAAQVDIPLVETVSGTTPTITGQPNVRYVCGEVSTISITPPASGSVDVIFESGSTATTMTVPSTVKWPAWFDAEALETNTTYEVLITDGIYGSVMTWAT